MGYRVRRGSPLTKVGPEGLRAVRSAIRKRDDTMALAMSFDPGTFGDGVLTTRAMDLLMGLLYLRGFRQEQHEVLIAKAEDWDDRWWQGALGPDAFIIETSL